MPKRQQHAQTPSRPRARHALPRDRRVLDDVHPLERGRKPRRLDSRGGSLHLRLRARRVCGRRRHGGRRARHRALAHALHPGGPDLRGKPLRGPRLRLLVDARRTIHRRPSARRLLRRGRHRGDQSRGARPGLARRLPDGHGHDDRQPRRRAARQLPRVVALVARHLRRRGLCGSPPHSGCPMCPPCPTRDSGPSSAFSDT